MYNNITYTPIGMTTTLIGQEMGCVCAILLSSTYLSIYVSTCLYISAFLTDVGKTFAEFDHLIEKKVGKYEINHTMKTGFVDMIQLYTKAIGLVLFFF